MLLPLQGVLLLSIRTPKALPWAMCFLGFQPVELTFNTPSFHILNADAALYAESGEECGDYAHDKLEHGLESFFV